MATIQFNRGLESNLPIGLSGEPMWTTDTFKLFIGDGTSNHEIGSIANEWHLTGNAGTIAGTNFIGTTDAVGLMFKVNNIQSGYINYSLESTSFGYQSLMNEGLAGDNTAFGHRVLIASTTGVRNTGVGHGVLQFATIADENTGVGHEALSITTGGFNTAVGSFSFYFNTTGYSNVGIGKNSGLNNTTGFQNFFGGAGSGENNTTGQENTFVGYDAGLNNTTGLRNFYGGWNAKGGTDGLQNVAIGYTAGASLTAGNSNNVFIGFQSGFNGSQLGDADNTIAIGANSFTTVDNTTVIGNSSMTQFNFWGALMPGGSAGTSGQVLTSGGANITPTWVTPPTVSGTTNYIPKFTGTSTIGNSDLFNTGGTVRVYNQAELAFYSDAGTTRLGGIDFASANVFNWRNAAGTVTLNHDFSALASSSKTATWRNLSGTVAYLSDVTAATIPINSLLAATGTNAINNADFGQTLQWNSLSASAGLAITSNSTAAASNNQKLFQVSLSGANSNSTQTTAAAEITNTHSGSSSTNIAGRFIATTGTTNYAINIEGGAIGLNSSAGTSGQVLTSAGANAIPTWTTPTTGTVTSVSGTANQIGSTGGATPVISLVSGGTLPGAWALGTPASAILTNATGLPPTTGISGWPANASGVLTNNGSGTLSWGAASSGITVGTTTITSGTSTRIPFNDGGVYAEDSALTWDKTNNVLHADFINVGSASNSWLPFYGDGMFYFRNTAKFNNGIEAEGGTWLISSATGGGIFGGVSPHASAKLQADSTTQGFLPPRMTTVQKNAIGTPATGLIVYDTTLNKLCIYTTAWETITSA